MKLELKHLAPYLPYGLKIDTSKLENGYSIMTMCDKGGLSNIEIGDVMDEYPYTKPILRPLSDLTKEIEVNGEKFVPIEEIKESQHHLFFREDIENPLEGVQYSEIQKLFEWHFDVFGLIEAGLAIDVNALSE
jgi:hypothetical protein